MASVSGACGRWWIRVGCEPAGDGDVGGGVGDDGCDYDERGQVEQFVAEGDVGVEDQ